MLSHDPFQNAASSDCDCCQLTSDVSVEGFDCSQRSAIFTPREQKVLSRIREAGERARVLKKQMRHYSAGGEGSAKIHAEALKELQSLRQLRLQLERERVAAAEERMRFLGHA